MRVCAIAAVVAAVVAPNAPTRTQDGKNAPDVIVYVTGSDQLSGPEGCAVRDVVDGMLAGAGVSIAWVEGKPKDGNGAGVPLVVHLRLARVATNAYSAGALANSTPFAPGVKTITVLYDRVRTIAGTRARQPHILAHVLAHELGHILIGTNGHSPTGVMKARWSSEDLLEMEKRQLKFTSGDLNLIREGLYRMKAQGRDFAGGDAKQ